MTIGQNKTALILSGKNEYKKQYYEYMTDLSGRLLRLWEAPVDQVNGAPCIVTKFAYVGSTTQLSGSVEFEGAWNSAWDIATP